MNYLAHLYLSSETGNAMVGSMLGDFIKGDDHLAYPDDVANAIILHRKVDAFTDSHPEVSLSKRRLDPVHRHTKGIMVDLFYDHFLAAHWDDYSDQPLTTFVAEAYAALQRTNLTLPERMQNMLPFLVSGDWLSSYREIEGVTRALGGLGRRLKVPNQLGNAGQDLRHNYRELEEDFSRFFPLLQGHVTSIKGEM